MRNIVLILLVTLLLTGCDLFSVRDSEPPAAQIPWIDFTTEVDSVLLNLEYSYEYPKMQLIMHGFSVPIMYFILPRRM